MLRNLRQVWNFENLVFWAFRAFGEFWALALGAFASGLELNAFESFFINIPNILADWADRLNKLEYIHDVSVVRVHEKARKQVPYARHHKPRILSLKNEEFPFLVYKLSAI
jgi:hypothetical protein